MKIHIETLVFAGACSLAVSIGAAAYAQSAAEAASVHRAAAVAAAGQDLSGLLAAICPAGAQQTENAAPGPRRGSGAGGPRPTPSREQWYAEPAKVFDNLYFVGTKAHGAWAITTSDGIIVIDALFGYAVKDEVEDGLRKVGLDPAKIKYLIVTHGHGDHSGGAKYIQDTFKPRLILGAKDWDLLERDPATAPRRDIEATDGQKLTLGDTTITLYLTPGHTQSTISVLIPVKDGNRSHMAAEWGGTVVSAATPAEQLSSYVRSAGRFLDLAAGSGADVILTNHTAYDGTFVKLDALKNRKPGDPHPYVVGKDTVKRYLTVASECGKANLAVAESRR